MNLKVEYVNTLISKIEDISYTENKWYDLRASESIKIHQGEAVTIPLGVKFDIPENCEVHIVAKRNLFKKYGLILTSGMEVIDSSVKEDLSVNVYATRDTKVNFNDRICQFRMYEIQERINFI